MLYSPHVYIHRLCFSVCPSQSVCVSVDNRLLEKSDLQSVLSERLQTEKYELQNRHDVRSVTTSQATVFVYVKGACVYFGNSVCARTQPGC